MKIGVLITIFLVFISCKNATEKGAEQVNIVADSAKLEVQTIGKHTENLKLKSFLEDPVDFQSFKKLKSINYTTTGVSGGMDYHLHPKINDSIFYSYNYPTPNLTDSKKIDQALVFKYGKNKHTYKDETEILIELRIFNEDSDLGKANLVGLTKTELVSEFGTDYLTWDNGIAYSNKNRILILELVKSKVESYRYVKLDTEIVDKALIRKITE